MEKTEDSGSTLVTWVIFSSCSENEGKRKSNCYAICHLVLLGCFFYWFKTNCYIWLHWYHKPVMFKDRTPWNGDQKNLFQQQSALVTNKMKEKEYMGEIISTTQNKFTPEKWCEFTAIIVLKFPLSWFETKTDWSKCSLMGSSWCLGSLNEELIQAPSRKKSWLKLLTFLLFIAIIRNAIATSWKMIKVIAIFLFSFNCNHWMTAFFCVLMCYALNLFPREKVRLSIIGPFPCHSGFLLNRVTLYGL